MMTLSVEMDAAFLQQYLAVARMTISLDITDAHFKQHVGSATLTITNSDIPEAELRHVVECPPKKKANAILPCNNGIPANRKIDVGGHGAGGEPEYERPEYEEHGHTENPHAQHTENPHAQHTENPHAPTKSVREQ